MPDPVEWVAIPFLWAMGACALVLLLGWRPWLSGSPRCQWVGPIAFAAGVLTPFARIVGAWPAFPPIAATGWIFYATVMAGIVEALLLMWRFPLWVRMIIASAVLGMSLFFVFLNPLRDLESSATVVKIVLLGTGVGTVWWWTFERSASAYERGTAPLALLLLSGLVSILLMMSGSVTYGRIGFSVAGAAAGLAILSIPTRPAPAEGCTIVVLVSLGTVLMAGYYFAELTWWNLTLVALAPAMMLLRSAIPHARQNGVKAALITLSLLILPLIVALTITAPYFLQQTEVDESGYGY